MNFIRIGLVLLSLLLVPAISQAEEPYLEARRSHAQGLSDEAFSEMEKKEYSSACPKLERAVALFPEGAGVKKTLASCYEASGRLASAWAQYQLSEAQAIKMGKKELADEAAAKAAELKPKLATVTIRLPEEVKKRQGLVLERDGIVLPGTQWTSPIPVDTGEHRFELKAPGYGGWSERIVVEADGVQKELRVPGPVIDTSVPKNEVLATVARPWQKPLGIATLALGMVGLGTGGALLGLAYGKKDESDANGHCDAQNMCDPTGLAVRHQAVVLRDASIAAFVVGGALAVGGVVLWATAPTSKKTNSTAVQWGIQLAPSQIRLRGAW